MKKIIRNAIQCKKCGEVIESNGTHQFVSCKCGSCAVDGGHEYLRRCLMTEDCYIELSETIEITDDNK